MPGPPIDRHQFNADIAAVVECLHEQLALLRVPQDIVRHLGGHDSHAANLGCVELVSLGEPLGDAADFPDLARVFDRSARLRSALHHADAHFQRVIVTRVPTPTVESISNSFTSRPRAGQAQPQSVS